MKKRVNRLIAIAAAFCIAFTCLPLLTGGLDVNAASMAKKKVATKITVAASASGQNRVNVSWNKIKSPQNGYAVFRNGKPVAHLGKKLSFADTRLSAGTTYTYQVKRYKVKKTTQWYNKKTGQWQKKKPAKKIRGKSRKVTTYTYSKPSNTVRVRTAAAPKPAVPALTAPTGVKVKATSNTSLEVTWNAVSGAEKYNVYMNGKLATSTKETGQKGSGLVAGKTYTFEISAVKGSVEKKSATVSVTLPKDAGSSTGNNTGNTGNNSVSQKETKTVTDYLGVTRTITKSSDEKYWYSTDGIQINPMARYDRTVDGTFDGFTQKNGVTWKIMPASENYYYTDSMGNWNPYVVMYNGNMDKLTFDVVNLKDVQTHYSDENCETKDRVVKVVEKDGKRLIKYYGVYQKKYYADAKGDVKYVSFEDREICATTQGIGFATGDVTVNIYYEGKQIGKWTHTCNANANSEGLSPFRQTCLEIARQCLADAKANGEVTGTLSTDMNAISKWININYTYGQNMGNDVKLTCLGGRDVLETWSIYKYGRYGFAYASNPYNRNHEAFRLDDLSAYWSAQGHD